MHCFIYKGNKKLDSYLFVEKKDNFKKVPADLLVILGKLEYVMAVNLKKRVRLACVSTREVKEYLDKQGYYLQSPPIDFIENKVPPPSF